MADKKPVKTGPPVDEREDDGRKDDHLSVNGAHVPELEKRAKFLSETQVKVVEPEAQDKPKSSSSATTK